MTDEGIVMCYLCLFTINNMLVTVLSSICNSWLVNTSDLILMENKSACISVHIRERHKIKTVGSQCDHTGQVYFCSTSLFDRQQI